MSAVLLGPGDQPLTDGQAVVLFDSTAEAEWWAKRNDCAGAWKAWPTVPLNRRERAAYRRETR